MSLLMKMLEGLKVEGSPCSSSLDGVKDLCSVPAFAMGLLQTWHSRLTLWSKKVSAVFAGWLGKADEDVLQCYIPATGCGPWDLLDRNQEWAAREDVAAGPT